MRCPASGSVRQAHFRPVGFSLVEMLVVLFLLSILVYLAFWMIVSNSRLARQGLARSSVYAGARNARAALANDLKFANDLKKISIFI